MLIFNKEVSNDCYYTYFTMGKTDVIIVAAICLAVMLTFYALRSVGLFVLARRKSFKFAWLSFVPCAWLYVACRLIEETRIFGMTFKKVALWATLIFAVGELLSLIYNFFEWYPVIAFFFQGGDVEIISGVGGGALVIPDRDTFVNVFPSVQLPVFKVINALSYVTSLITTVVTVFLYINLFRNYWPQHYVLASVLSFFGLFGVFVFVIRNKSEMKYSDYLRTRYGGVYGPYSNPYYRDRNGANGGAKGGNYERPPETPFKDFAERGETDPGDPFSEFADEDKKDENKK